ncbi:endothelial zinc finger protein induced by tumor necrosis factor alpha-like [Chiloscyllium plagiosum]|uniref:endothelial zinc finger protein induced by tumor necrosis factor alpha-like n=1 Tax=Chiloscyllium plagiosum TaxID=36176 RepID=UPI001CB84BBD|nr:endothelial zinc finger protein induced by tumor necrosis factor alpha-like [Chiloscyllium plagiosum]
MKIPLTCPLVRTRYCCGSKGSDSDFTKNIFAIKDKEIEYGEEALQLPRMREGFQRFLLPVEASAGPHGGEAFQLPECRKAFSVSSSLLMHQQAHTGERPFTCSECERGFSQMSQLKTQAAPLGGGSGVPSAGRCSLARLSS